MVRDKQQALKQEEDKLAQKQKERNEVKEHHEKKLEQMRKEMDQETTSPKIQQMKIYLKIVQDRLKVEDKKVNDQKEQVKVAEKNVELAKMELKRKRQEVDKLLTHQTDWHKEKQKEADIVEGREQDELGSVMYLLHHKFK